MPLQKSWIPAIKHIIQAREGHPATLSPKRSALTKIKQTPRKANRQNIMPIMDEIAKGAVENATTPSIA